MAAADLTCVRCGASAPATPEGTCRACGAPVDVAQAAPRPRPAVVLPETDPRKLVKPGVGVPVLAAGAVVSALLVAVGIGFAARRGPAEPARTAVTAAPASADGATDASGDLLAPGVPLADPALARGDHRAGSPGPTRMPPRSRHDGAAARDAAASPAAGAPPATPGAPVVPAAATAPAAAPTATPAVPLPPPPQDTSLVEDAPRYPAEGFEKPRLEEPGCVQANLRVPRDLATRLSGAVSIRFAVGVDGTPGLFEVLGEVQDRRLSEALWTALRSCRFAPGKDAAGRPTRLWVVMPLRFDGR
jgi:hypothetical protein